MGRKFTRGTATLDERAVVSYLSTRRCGATVAEAGAGAGVSPSSASRLSKEVEQRLVLETLRRDIANLRRQVADLGGTPGRPQLGRSGLTIDVVARNRSDP